MIEVGRNASCEKPYEPPGYRKNNQQLKQHKAEVAAELTGECQALPDQYAGYDMGGSPNQS